MHTWDDYRRTCIHGIREGLDSHDCPECYKIAKESGCDVSNGKTYLYTKKPKPLKPPKKYWEYHHKDCGRKYRGCHPTKCPKNQYEETGVWKFNKEPKRIPLDLSMGMNFRTKIN